MPQLQCYTDTDVNQCLDNLVIMGFQTNVNFFEFMCFWSVISEFEFPGERAEAKLKRIINSTIKLLTVLQ